MKTLATPYICLYYYGLIKYHNPLIHNHTTCCSYSYVSTICQSVQVYIYLKQNGKQCQFFSKGVIKCQTTYYTSLAILKQNHIAVLKTKYSMLYNFVVAKATFFYCNGVIKCYTTHYTLLFTFMWCHIAVCSKTYL